MQSESYPSSHIIHAPQRYESAIVFASPHSGRFYPPEFLRRSRLDSHQIRASEDAFVDQLFADAPAQGAPLLVANYPRAYVDLNRSAADLDPALIMGVTGGAPNMRVASGLGVIPRIVAARQPIYTGKIPLPEAETRLQQVWHPYHTALRGLMQASSARHGHAILIDCHSMPPEASGPDAPDIVLGDKHGRAADGAVRAAVIAALQGEGFRVSVNTPFAGAYVTETYGRPARGWHALQLEVSRGLYLDATTLTPHTGFAPLRARLSRVIARLVGLGRDRIAAE
ncbi:N-formylglutamate amidohydrolase [Ketogulonicigenium robustum]|uniref:N-formylglutamate amidohydrolase n=1 Tax=Ketogulonicigenium robustum TaxID=92947 RepID=A0A1W6P1I7_9RHOB|nr:N-formylglutamate amidohydrolase [Ketogulonicigenium robustum]ARO15366.1 N-formylglutamate amidohydrolase [Ketogulonicigenium robustum]